MPSRRSTPSWQYIRLLELSNLRAASAFVAPILLGLGIIDSTDGKHHRLATYSLWYGLTAVLIVAIIVMTMAINRGDNGTPSSGSKFAQLRGGSTFHSESSYSRADTFFDLDEGSKATSRDDVHDPHARDPQEADED
jgi:hypothetical protein